MAPTGTPGPSVRVDYSNGIYQVMSSPFPVHRATVEKGVTGWVVIVHTASVRRTWHRNPTDALRDAGTKIGALYRLDMRSRFTGPQRQAIGLGQCPAHKPCRDRTCTISASHSHLCRRAPWFASIWCESDQASGERTWQT